ncbi:MAG: DNA polymerase III subunit gamma/tau [Acidobacteria bacterium]|nr:DNA polymerase III subunit gamma/tau [Acidobacteriota bacterium]
MSYQVLARKWRPQQFEEVVGQEPVTRTLQNAIRMNRVSHAHLLAGPRGVGKTTTARILAKALNCVQGPTAHPCGECPSCVEIADGRSLDVLEIDAASNRGIDQIRELRENVRYQPARDRYKIFIVDEVHMLTTEAFNALLKTLEEPPGHVIFILATTEFHKIPPTILSRCQQFHFKMISHQKIVEQLQRIARSEGVSISETALEAIVHASEGSMRDAESALDQIVAASGLQVRDDDARALLGLVEYRVLESFTEALLARDAGRILELIQELADHGLDLQNLMKQYLHHLRNLLVIRIAPHSGLLVVTDHEREGLSRLAQKFQEVDLLRFFDLVSRTIQEIKWSPVPRFHVEAAFLKLVELQRLESLETVLARLQGIPAERAPATPAEKKSAASSSVPEKPGDWSQELMRVLGKEKASLYNIVKRAQQLRAEGQRLHISFSSGDDLFREMLQDRDNLEGLKQICARVAAQPIQVVIESSAEEVPAGAAASPAPPSGAPSQDDAARPFLDLFPGRITYREGRD